jgi:uncharacterized phage protein (TIGR01671 family)
MREIKFRAWDGKRMDYSFNPVVHGEYNFFMLSSAYHIYCPESVLMQYAGLEDKDGKEIYEGDVLAIPNCLDETRRLFSVEFGRAGFDGGHDRYCFQGFWLKPMNNKAADESHSLLFANEEIEVIGNIYENPELKE